MSPLQRNMSTQTVVRPSRSRLRTTVHYYTHNAYGKTYGLSRTARQHAEVMGLAHETHFAPRMEGAGVLGHLHVLAERAYADVLGRVHRPSHALSVTDAVAGNDVVTVHDLIPWVHRREYLAWGTDEQWLEYERKSWHRALRQARHVVAISDAARKDLNALGYRCDSIIPNLLGLPSGAGPPAPNGHREGVLIVGENEPRKRWELAVEVAAFLGEPLIWIGHRNDLDWKMAYERAVMDRARHLAVRVHRLPDAGDDQLVASYRTARVLVAPSLWEGFNLPIVEALQHGLPAVAIAPRRGYVEDVFGDHVPVADDALDVPDLARFDAAGAFAALDEEMGLTDAARYREQYVRVYEEAGIE